MSQTASKKLPFTVFVMALAVAQTHSSHELRLLPHGFPATDHPEDHECLVKDFFNTANSIALASQAEDIVNEVFPGS